MMGCEQSGWQEKNTWKRWNAVSRPLTCTRVRHMLWQNNNTLPCQGCSGDGWSVETQRVGSQPVFDITVQPMVQRPGSADGNHRRRRSAVHSGSQNIQPCAAAPLFLGPQRWSRSGDQISQNPTKGCWLNRSETLPNKASRAHVLDTHAVFK